MKKFMPFLALTLFLSITSCDSSDDQVDAQNVGKLNKQKQILTKLEELGIDSKNVTFPDKIEGEKVVIESLDDFEKIFPKELNGKEIKINSVEKNSTSSKPSGSDPYGPLDYRRFDATITIPNQPLTLYYEFYWNRFYLDTTSSDGIKSASVFLLGGSVNGITYSMDYFTYDVSGGNCILKIRGFLYYPVVYGGQPAQVIRPVTIICSFMQNMPSTNIPPYTQFLLFPAVN